MEIPFFYSAHLGTENFLTLDEANSKHAIAVLRMQAGQELCLTDGKGRLLTAVITEAHKKHCQVRTLHTSEVAAAANRRSIGVSLLRNAVRFEWFLEKATEMGVTDIFPLLCTRTTKEQLRRQRFESILVSALLQSRQTWLPKLHELQSFNQAITISADQKFIAHCMDGEKQALFHAARSNAAGMVVLIGPEGDFTPEELAAAVENGFVPVSLGKTRLRTETAAMIAVALMTQSMP